LSPVIYFFIYLLDTSATTTASVYIRWSDVTVICGWSHYYLYVVRQHGVYCVKLSGEDLSRCSIKTESVGLRECPYYHHLTLRKWCRNNRRFSELVPHHGGKTSWHRYGMKRLRHCQHTLYINGRFSGRFHLGFWYWPTIPKVRYSECYG